MPHGASLKIDGLEAPLKRFKYYFSRPIEDNGKPSAMIRKVIIEISKDSIPHKGFYMSWLADPSALKDGEIIITELTDNSIFKTIKFTSAHIFQYSEEFQQGNEANSLESFTIAAQTIDIDGAGFEFDWPEF